MKVVPFGRRVAPAADGIDRERGGGARDRRDRLGLHAVLDHAPAVAATIRHIGTPNSTASLTSGKADVVVDADAPGQGAIRVVVDSKLIANCRVGGAISAVPVKLNLGLTRWEAALNPC